MPNIYTEFFKSGALVLIGKYLLILLPIALPIILLYAFWVIRFRWVTMKFVEAQKPCLLEIRLPKEITKSPAAMEIFFSHLNQSGAGNYGEAFIDGKTRAWFSCEIVSTGGHVRFFVWCRNAAKYRNLVEAQLYAQYPNLEIFEAEDYTKDFYFDKDKYPMFGVQFGLSAADPFPIKTYIDYGLDKDQKDEYKVDPITSVIEFLGSLKSGENAWIQILVQKHEKESWTHGTLTMDEDPKKVGFLKQQLIKILGRSKDLKDEVQVEIEKIREKAVPKPAKKEDKDTFKFPNPTKGQNEVIAALERSATKTAYDCMIRCLYITEKDSFFPANIGGLTASFKQYSSKNLNGFWLKDCLVSDADDVKKDWARIFPFYQRKLDKDVLSVKRSLLYAYKLRSFFQYPYKNLGKKGIKTRPFVLTTEELATIWHFPSGLVSQTPTLKRVGSKKSEAPSNLPI